MNADERRAAAPQGEIRDLVEQLKSLIGQTCWSMPDNQRMAIVLCNEILVVEKRFTDAAQTLAGRCYQQAGELRTLRRQLELSSEVK